VERSEPLRGRYLPQARRIVVKVGTNVLASPGMPLDAGRVDLLGSQAARLASEGRQVTIVSSGAIGAGMAELGIRERPRTLRELQACASVGQGRLMARYEESLRRHGLHAGQVLLTREDFDSRQRYLNARNTLLELFELGCVPVINENDAISTDEIRFGDNDLLAAHVTGLVGADALILLTSVPGLYVNEPLPAAVRSVRRAEGGTIADVVQQVDEAVLKMARQDRTPGGTGGMESKLQAARIVTRAGEAAVIADGAEEEVLCRRRSARFSSRPPGGCAAARDGFASRAARGAPWWWTRARAGRSASRARACCPSA